jgi:hypothetical protein
MILARATPRDRGLIAALCTVQFLHFFKPSEPLLYDILSSPPLSLSRAQVLDDVFAWSVYWQPVAYLLVYLVYRRRGYGAALLFVCCASAATVALVLAQLLSAAGPGAGPAGGPSGGSSGGWAAWKALPVAYELTWSVGFAVLFVSSAATFDALPPHLFQEGASCVRAAALLGTVLSSSLGGAMAGALPHETLWVSLATALLALGAVLGARRPGGCGGGSGRCGPGLLLLPPPPPPPPPLPLDKGGLAAAQGSAREGWCDGAEGASCDAAATAATATAAACDEGASEEGASKAAAGFEPLLRQQPANAARAAGTEQRGDERACDERALAARALSCFWGVATAASFAVHFLTLTQVPALFDAAANADAPPASPDGGHGAGASAFAAAQAAAYALAIAAVLLPLQRGAVNPACKSAAKRREAAMRAAAESESELPALRLGLPVPLADARRLAFSLAGVVVLSQLAMAAAAEPAGAALALGMGSGAHARVAALALAFVVFHASSELLLVMAKAELAKALVSGKGVAAAPHLVPACTAREPFSSAFVLAFLASWLQQFALEQLTLGISVVGKLHCFALAYAALIVVPGLVLAGCQSLCARRSLARCRKDDDEGQYDGQLADEKSLLSSGR